MKHAAIVLGAFVSFTACGGTQVETDLPPTADEIRLIVTETDQPICSLDLSGVLAEGGHELEGNEFADFLNFTAFATKTNASSGEPLRKVYRRAALHRLFHAAETGELLDADAAYAALTYDRSEPVNLTAHIERSNWWDERLSEQQAREDSESADYNLRFCVINERGGAARAAARQFVIDSGANISEDLVRTFVTKQKYFAAPFKKHFLDSMMVAEAKDPELLLQLALMRDHTSTLMDTDPTTALEFWAARDAEIDAVLAHISEAEFETTADKLTAMTSVDQSLRHLYSVLERQGGHFDTPEELEAVKAGLGDRVVRVDAFNTTQLDEMLDGRNWFRDDVDGQRAGHNAWLVAQHADLNPEFQRKVLPMIEAELGAPGVSKQNYAYLYDRVAGKDERLQRYGTQGRCTGPETWEPNEIEDPENVDTRRAEMGLGPMADYIARFKGICFSED